MEGFTDVNAGEVLGFLDLTGKMIKIRELSGVLECLVIEQTEVSARSFRAIRLALEMQWGAVIVGIIGIHFFHNTQLFHLFPRGESGFRLW